MNPDDPRLKYTIAKVGEYQTASGLPDEIWAGHVSMLDQSRHMKLLGVSEGINKDVVMRLLRRKASIWGEPVSSVQIPTPYTRVNASRRWPKRRETENAKTR